jgi:hypothetical protein
MKKYLLLLSLLFTQLFPAAQQLDATFSVVPGTLGNYKLRMVLNAPVTFRFNEDYSSSQNSVTIIVKNVYSSSPGNHTASATGLSYSTSSGKVGSIDIIGGYGFDYGLFKTASDEAVNFTLPAGATLLTNETLTVPAGTVIQTDPGNFSSSQTFVAGPYTAFLPNSSDFTRQAAVIIATPEINETVAKGRH